MKRYVDGKKEIMKMRDLAFFELEVVNKGKK